EFNGNLRVATTARDPESTESFVTVLADDTHALQTIGQVGGLGKGERIYAVRFVDAVGYVVTFRRTDPLYTVDLRDPRHPQVVGSLEVTGYSSYIHPIGDGLLIGVGSEVEPGSGRRTAAQVSLF